MNTTNTPRASCSAIFLLHSCLSRDENNKYATICSAIFFNCIVAVAPKNTHDLFLTAFRRTIDIAVRYVIAVNQSFSRSSSQASGYSDVYRPTGSFWACDSRDCWKTRRRNNLSARVNMAATAVLAAVTAFFFSHDCDQQGTSLQREFSCSRSRLPIYCACYQYRMPCNSHEVISQFGRRAASPRKNTIATAQ